MTQNHLSVEVDDQGGNIFYNEIAALFDRMKEEETPGQESVPGMHRKVVELIVERCGILSVLTSICGSLSEKASNCPHIEWLSNNLNALVNRATEHNQEQYGFPFNRS